MNTMFEKLRHTGEKIGKHWREAAILFAIALFATGCWSSSNETSIWAVLSMSYDESGGGEYTTFDIAAVDAQGDPVHLQFMYNPKTFIEDGTVIDGQHTRLPFSVNVDCDFTHVTAVEVESRQQDWRDQIDTSDPSADYYLGSCRQP